MAIEFSLTQRQRELRDMVRSFAKNVIRPESLAWDRAHGIPDDFLVRFTMMASSMGGTAGAWGVQGLAASASDSAPAKSDKPSKAGAMISTLVGAEELAFGDAALLLCLPGPGLGGPPVRSAGTPEQKERFFAPFKEI